MIGDWQSLKTAGRAVRVDREAGVIHGYVVAQLGPFKTPGRGEFDDKSLASIVKLMKANKAGTKSRFGHPTMSDDGLGKFLGRAFDPRLDDDGTKVRADLKLSPTSRATPAGDLGGYVLDLAEADPDAFSSSLVLQVDQEYRLDRKGQRLLDEATGEPLPPLWRPKAIHASDIVETGDAVDGLLSAGIDPDGLPLAALWQASRMLDSLFPNADRREIEDRLSRWSRRYLDARFPPEAVGPDELDRLRRRIRLAESSLPR